MRHKVKNSINFDGYSNIPTLELGNIPEVLDESINNSDRISKLKYKSNSNSNSESINKEEFKWNKSDSINKSNSGTKTTNSPK